MEAGKRAEDELSTEECLGLIDEMKALGTEMLILTGGEPLLRRDIYDIAKYASDHGIWVVMGTNGVLVTDKVVKKMLECGVRGVGISIDSLDPDKHNSFRGGPNSWEYSVRALEICKEQGLDVLVQSTVMENNYDEIPRLIDFAQEKGAWSFNLYFLVRTGRGHEMNDLSPEKTEAMLADLVEVQDRYRPMLVRSKCAPHFKRIAYEKGVGGLESGGCMAGTQYGRITPDGDVTPCPYMTIVAGNVREKGLTGIWKTSPVLEELRYLDRLKGRCGICEFKELCGGCRCRAYAAFGDYLQEDPACTYQPTGHELDFGKITWSPEASARLKRIPIRFVREKVEKGVETYAQRKDVRLITPDLMKEAIAGMERPTVFGKMPDFRKHEDQEKKKAKN
jgi:radical SAM protein with 4Fe4S-binding SPASM domain